ncbi:MAG TPA: S1 RNA-binding domain-containing protein [Candidatus Coprocola pullicola]|nr:S1 RNA-binding domain-containing protein [Candidatus Coprocola pullicola]
MAKEEAIMKTEDTMQQEVLEKMETEEAVTVFPKEEMLTLQPTQDTENKLQPEDIAWHEVQSATRTRKILTGMLSGIEKLENDTFIAVVYFKGIRVIIPLSEMMIDLKGETSGSVGEYIIRQTKVLNNMMGCDIDFIVKGIDNKSKSVVASRKDAMEKKQQIYYMTPNENGKFKVREGRIVEGRVIAVAQKVVRVEIFGVECSIAAKELTWDWLGDARERFCVGEVLPVKILNIDFEENADVLKIEASVKQATENTLLQNLKKCRVQGKYAGKITDIVNGNIYVRLHIGVNAVAHTYNDPRMPGKKDEVSFVVTRLDEERGIAVGIITRIIRQNI